MQPIIIEDSIAIAANFVNQNVINSNSSLQRFLRAPFACQGKFIGVISAAGLTITLDYGSKNVIAPSVLRVGTDLQDPLDVTNDHWFAKQGDQLVLAVTNSTAGSLTLKYRITLMPLPDEYQNPAAVLPPDARVQQRLNTITTLQTDVQVMQGLRYERAPNDSYLSIYATAQAVGLTRTLYVDTTNVAPPSAIAPLNRVPQDPFDLNVEAIEVGDDQIISLGVSNPTGGSIDIFWRMKLQELVRT